MARRAARSVSVGVLAAGGLGPVADASAGVLGHPAGVAQGVRVGRGPLVDGLACPLVAGVVGQGAGGVEGLVDGAGVGLDRAAGLVGGAGGESAEGAGRVAGEDDGLGGLVHDGEPGADALAVVVEGVEGGRLAPGGTGVGVRGAAVGVGGPESKEERHGRSGRRKPRRR